jgi:hypothetical protein
VGKRFTYQGQHTTDAKSGERRFFVMTAKQKHERYMAACLEGVLESIAAAKELDKDYPKSAEGMAQAAYCWARNMAHHVDK